MRSLQYWAIATMYDHSPEICASNPATGWQFSDTYTPSLSVSKPK